MNKYIVLTLMFLALLFSGCNKEEIIGGPIPFDVNLSVKDKDGNNLLDSTFNDNVLDSFQYAVIGFDNYFHSGFVPFKKEWVKENQRDYLIENDNHLVFTCFTGYAMSEVFEKLQEFQIIATFDHNDVRIYNITSSENIYNSSIDNRGFLMFSVDGVKMKNADEIVLIR